MVTKLQQGGIRGTNNRVIKEVSVRVLEDGKFQGVFAHLSISVTGNKEIEFLCKEHRITAIEALQDAKDLAEKN